MWIRSELKERGKASFKSSYVKSVIVCLIFFVLLGWQEPSSFVSKISKNIISGEAVVSISEKIARNDVVDYILNGGNLDRVIADEGLEVFLASLPFVFLFIILSILGIVIGLLINVLIIWPLLVGKFRFFMELREGKDSLDSLLVGYKADRIKNIGITFFLKSLYLFFWYLLLVIPGIIKSYEYRMIPYILSENPTIDTKRAFEISKRMMSGNKWNTFVLDLSFIGWYILASFTFGILNVAYVNPYVQATNAELYAYLREEALANGTASRAELVGF